MKHIPCTCPECSEDVETEFADHEEGVDAWPANDQCEHCGEPLYEASGAVRGSGGDDYREDFHSDI